MHAPRAVHACTFFNVNVDADVNNLRRVSIAEQVNVIVSVNVDFSRSLVIVNVNVNVFLASPFAKKLRFPNRLKYQPHLIAREVAGATRVACALQRIEQSVGGVYVFVEQPQGRGTRGTGAVELRQFGLAVGAEFIMLKMFHFHE